MTSSSGKESKGHSYGSRSVRTKYIFASLAGVAILIIFFVFNSISKEREAENTAFGKGIPERGYESYSVQELLGLSDEELEKRDIALMNLVCAKGLRGSENLDIVQCLQILDKWAEIVKTDTEKRIQSFYSNPSKYDNSVNLFKVVNMVLTLKEQIGVDYNLEIMKKTEFLDSKDFFIHGCLTGNKQGGCISIPVLCVCVGRRLGYPLKLVLAREHTFFRWDDGK